MKQCACANSDARTCIRLRYPLSDFSEDLEHEFVGIDRCECCCHDLDEADDEYENS